MPLRVGLAVSAVALASAPFVVGALTASSLFPLDATLSVFWSVGHPTRLLPRRLGCKLDDQFDEFRAVGGWVRDDTSDDGS